MCEFPLGMLDGSFPSLQIHVPKTCSSAGLRQLLNWKLVFDHFGIPYVRRFALKPCLPCARASKPEVPSGPSF